MGKFCLYQCAGNMKYFKGREYIITFTYYNIFIFYEKYRHIS